MTNLLGGFLICFALGSHSRVQRAGQADKRATVKKGQEPNSLYEMDASDTQAALRAMDRYQWNATVLNSMSLEDTADTKKH